MKLRLLSLMILIGLALAIPGRARSLDAPEPSWKSRMRQEGWREVQEGVLRREAGGGRMETFTYGEAGRRWAVRRLEERIRSLQRESERYPSADLTRILKTLRRELRQATAELKATIPEPLGEKSGCDPGFDLHAAADPLWTGGPGVQASAGAFFHSPCSDPGNSYAYAYARATVGNTMTIRSQEDPESGAWVDSTASASVAGSSSCYSEAYARSWSSTTAFSYEAFDTNYSCPSQTPYLGTPFAVPGTIHAIDFDNGGEGIAYHEITPYLNSAYRATEVNHYENIITKFDDGEWLEYTIDVARTGTYALVAQTGVDGHVGIIHVELDGTDVTGPMTVPDTGGWANWSSPTKQGLSLSAGLHVLRVVADQGIHGFQSLRLVDTSTPQTPFGGIARALPGTLKVVEFDEGGEQVAYHDNSAGCEGDCSYRSNPDDVDRWEQVIDHTRAGEWLEYTVDVTATGTYTLSVQAGAENGGATFHVEFNGVDVTGPMIVPTTGSWATVQTVTRTGVSLTAGRKILRIVIDDDAGVSDAGSFKTLTVQP